MYVTRSATGVLIALFIALVMTSSYLRIEQELEATLKSKLVSVLQGNARSVEQWLDEQISLVQSLGSKPAVQLAAASILSAEQGQHEKSLDRALGPIIHAPWIEGIRLFGAQGKGLASTSTLEEPFPLPDPMMRQLKQKGSATWFIEATRNQKQRRRALPAKVVACAPLEPPSVKQAILCIVLSGASFGKKLGIVSWGQSSQTYIFRHNDFPATDPPRPLESSPESSKSSIGINVSGYKNPRGSTVVGAWQWLEPHGIGIATEVSRAEAYESINVLRTAFILLGALVGLALLGFLVLGRWTFRIRQESARVAERLGHLSKAIQPLSAALEHDPTAVLLIDDDARVVYANAASHRVLQVSGPLMGQTIADAFKYLPPELESALDSGQDSIVARSPEDDGETLLVSSRELQIHGIPHFLYLLRPITQQIRRQELENLRKLIRILSHELNNSLAPISSLINSAKRLNHQEARSEKLEEILTAISERSAHLRSFLEQYGAVARLPLPKRRQISWADFIHGLSQQGTFQLRGELPSEPGFFDPIQVERVVLNLLANAKESGSPDSEIALSVTEEDESFKMEVLDRGSGMPEKVLRQALLPFFSTKDSGTGIGLALCREIVEAHGGELVVANRDGGGLTVSCTLPKRPSPAKRGSLSRLRTRLNSEETPDSSRPRSTLK